MSLKLNTGLQFLAGALVASLMLSLVYQLPPVQQRLAWRLDILLTRLRLAVQPVGEMPLPASVGLPQLSPTPRVSPVAPSQTIQVTQQPTVLPWPAFTSSLLGQPGSVAQAAAATPTPLPGRILLPAPKYERQDWNNCGPAALALALRYWGWEGDQFDIAEKVKPLRADRNVNIDELVQFVLQNLPEMRAQFRVGGDLSLLRRSLALGQPVLVEVSFKLEEAFWYQDDRWAGHYLLVTGYDDSQHQFTVQDVFAGPDRLVSYADLNAAWQSFNYAYLLVYRLDQEDMVRSLLGPSWDADANRRQALETAQAETQKDASNPFAWFNLGSNLVYFEHYAEAARAYDTARRLGLPQRMLRYQFGPFLAYFHSGRNKDLLALSEYALKVTPNSEEALLWRGWALYRVGDQGAALEHFRRALEAHPDYADALYAIRFIQEH